MLLRIAFHHTQNYADAEDITQETFLALMKNPCAIEEQSLKAWLIRVTINKCRDLRRTAARQKNVALAAAVGKCNFDAEDLGVIECINKLKPIERDIVYLHYFEGFSAKVTGELLGKSEGMVFTRLKRIRIKLKNILEDENEQV